MTLLAIILGTLASGIGSVWLAAWLSFGLFSRYTQHMLSLAAGALLATAFLHLLPEAFEGGIEPHNLFVTLLVGLLFFFLLDKAELWHHGHEHHHHNQQQGRDAGHNSGHDHGHGHSHGHSHAPVAGTWAVLTGDSVHCFGDGVLIASAFVADLRLGAIAALAVLAHEVPHHMGDLVVLQSSRGDTRGALIKVSLAGTVTALGGLCGYFLLAQFGQYLPYFLVVAASSFIYVALADLIPQLQRQASLRESGAQLMWLLLGIGVVFVVGELAHGGAH